MNPLENHQNLKVTPVGGVGDNLKALQKIRELLLKNEIELDYAAQKALYENLWDLYLL